MKIKLFQTELADKNCGLVEGMIVEAQPVDYMKVVRDALGEGFDLMEPALREDVIEWLKSTHLKVWWCLLHRVTEKS